MNKRLYSAFVKKTIFSLTILFLFLKPSTAQTENQINNQDAFSIIMENIQTDIKGHTDPAKIVQKTFDWLSLLEENGSFSDINYPDQSRTNWLPLKHLERLKDMSLAFTMKESILYDDTKIYDTIVKMFEFWLHADPQSDNWWMQRIAVPQQLGLILIILRSSTIPLPQKLENNLLKQMEKSGGSPDKAGTANTGANKLDIATHWIYQGCLTKNEYVLRKGVEQAFLPLQLTTGEGFQHDLSYHQHGPQLYIGGYGKVILYGCIDLAKYLTGTPYALPKEKMDFLYHYLYSTYLPSIRGQYALYNVAGRSLARYNGLYQGGLALKLNELATLDSNRKEFYEIAKKRIEKNESATYGVLPSHTHYWRSDYTLHQRPGYTIDVRMASSQTYKSETVNGENLKGYFLTDGAMDIAITGNEYVNIFPAWDWAKIPGTTTPALPTELIPPLESSSKKRFGESRFAGGVSNRIYGVTAYQMGKSRYKETAMSAKKSWFFFDHEIVCLGAGITSKNPNFHINTTLNQCLLLSSIITVSTDGSENIFHEDTSLFFRDLSWVFHHRTGYYFPKKKEVIINCETKNGNWNLISPSNKEETKNVFTLCIDHGIAPFLDDYIYFIVPEIQSVEEARNYSAEDITIIQNTESIQAVFHQELDILSAVFYEPVSLAYDSNIRITVSQPCIIMIQDVNKDNSKLYIADPSKEKRKANIDIMLPNMYETVKIKCFFPTEKAYRGSSVEYIISK